MMQYKEKMERTKAEFNQNSLSFKITETSSCLVLKLLLSNYSIELMLTALWSSSVSFDFLLVKCVTAVSVGFFGILFT